MKKKQLLWLSATFVAGALAGIFLMGLLSFRSPSNPQQTTLTAAQAHTYLNNYLASVSGSTCVVKAFTLDKADVTAMSSLLTVPGLAGFRIYNGIDNTGAKIAIIVPIDNTTPYGADLTTAILSAPVTKLGPCPPVCDVNSQIIKGQ
jgi:hypothetical protein